MPRLFVPASAIDNGVTVIDGVAARHLSALRVKAGEQVRIVDDGGTEHGLVVVTATSDSVECRVTWSRPASGDPELHVTVLQAVCKDGMAEAIDAAVAAGAAAIAPVVTERTIVDLSGERAARRAERWQAVAREAAQVAFRATVPEVFPVRPLREAVNALAPSTRLLVCAMTDNAKPLAERTFETNSVALVIGPEGGFSVADLDTLAMAGAEAVHLGPRVFRSRLAASHALIALMLRAGELTKAVAQAPQW